MILPVQINENDQDNGAREAYPCFSDPEMTLIITCYLCNQHFILPSAL